MASTSHSTLCMAWRGVAWRNDLPKRKQRESFWQHDTTFGKSSRRSSSSSTEELRKQAWTVIGSLVSSICVTCTVDQIGAYGVGL